jgi:hypothetical protein
MREMYNRDPDVYAAMGETRALHFLLDRARDREETVITRQAYDEVRGIMEGSDAGGAPVHGQPAAVHPGTLARSGPVSARARAAAGNPNGNWSTTPAMRGLFGHNDGSIDEAGWLNRVLRERGHGEHIG